MMFEQIKADLNDRMDASIQSSKTELSGIRAGRASPSMLESIRVDAYGQKMNINQVANITTPDARTINVDIWDQANVSLVDKALRESDLSITPVIEGNLIRLPLPQLTEERRIEFLKMASKISEATKIAIRNIRRDGIENAGLVKFDFLGLKTLTLINECIKLVRNNNLDFSIDKININDVKTYELLSTGETTGIFQLESAGMKDTLKQLKPDKFEDIIAIVALYRPGPMANIPSYIERKHGREKPDYIHPLLKGLLKETYGVVIYQEQVMGVARELSGYSDGEADLLRRAMGKKIQKEMKAQKQRFINGCVNNKLKNNEAENIFELLSKFADYGFNKSHAAAYALIAFQTAFLKTHFPIEFFAASMSLDINNTDKISIFQQELVRMNIKLIPPSINQSNPYFSREGEKISYALGAIKNVGIESMNDLIKERKSNGIFRSFSEFIHRCNTSVINKKTLEALACAGAFDEFSVNRSSVFNQAQDIVKFHKSQNNKSLSDQEDMFENIELSHFTLNEEEEWAYPFKLMKEYEMLGFYLRVSIGFFIQLWLFINIFLQRHGSRRIKWH